MTTFCAPPPPPPFFITTAKTSLPPPPYLFLRGKLYLPLLFYSPPPPPPFPVINDHSLNIVYKQYIYIYWLFCSSLIRFSNKVTLGRNYLLMNGRLRTYNDRLCYSNLLAFLSKNDLRILTSEDIKVLTSGQYKAILSVQGI